MLSSWRNFSSLAIQNVPKEDSDQTEQADLNLGWAQVSEDMFSDIVAQIHSR